MVFETVFWFSFLSLWDNNLINSPGTALSTLFFSKTTLRTTSGSGFWDVDSIWVKMITVLGMSSLKIYNFFAIQQIFVICNSYNPCHLKPSYLGFSMGQSKYKKRALRIPNSVWQFLQYSLWRFRFRLHLGLQVIFFRQTKEVLKVYVDSWIAFSQGLIHNLRLVNVLVFQSYLIF